MSQACPLISVVVVNWNRENLLRACLGSLRSQTFNDFELIVVDNGSTDGSRDAQSDGAFPGARWILNSANRGFCAAANQGIAAARGRYVAFLNNDAEAEPDWLSALNDAIQSHPDIGMVASKIVAWDDRGMIDKAGHLIYPDGQNRGRGSGEQDYGQFDRVEEVAWPDGCAALYRREMLDSTGGFDEDFFAYADDAELGLRGQLAGWRCLYAPRAVVSHRLGGTLGRFSEQRLFLIERNRVWLVAKLFPWSLLLRSPIYFGLRVLASAPAMLCGRGEAGLATQRMGAFRLIRCFVKAQAAALAGLPAMLRKRRGIEKFRKLSPAELRGVLRRFRIPLSDLVWKAR
jgi:GT2 family glycosyltransferase